MLEDLRAKAANELERVVRCREIARAHWKTHPNPQDEEYRLESLGQFNEVVIALKEGLAENSADLMMKGLALAGRTP